jgi:hypothetical protein
LGADKSLKVFLFKILSPKQSQMPEVAMTVQVQTYIPSNNVQKGVVSNGINRPTALSTDPALPLTSRILVYITGGGGANCYENPHPKTNTYETPCPEPASELYRPGDLRLSAKLVPTCADRGCHVVSETDLYVRIIGFLDRNRYFFFQVAPQLYSRG